MASIGSGFGALPSVAEAPVSEAPRKRAEPPRDDSRTAIGAPARREAAPAGTAAHRGVARLRHAELMQRFQREQLRRMARAAFGPAVDNLHQQAREAMSELAGDRAPDTSTNQEGDESFRRYVVLREALEMVTDDPSRAALREKIEQALETLVTRHGDRIVAGHNIADVLEKYADTIQTRDELRRLYHDAVCTHDSVAQTYDALLAAFGPDRLQPALKALREAITEDMSSPFASADTRHLAMLHADLSKVGTVSSLHLALSAQALQACFPSLAQQQVRAEFIGRLLHLVVDGGTRAQLKQLADWLAHPGGAEEDEDNEPAPATVSARTVRAVLQRPEQREETLRRFLKDQVPETLWKPNTRSAITELVPA